MSEEITPAELSDLLGADGVRIVDIRSPAQFERERIPGSENIPFQDLPQRVESLEDANHVVTVCPHGKASLQAVQLIDSYEGAEETTIQSLEGGLEAWRDEYPLDAAEAEEADSAGSDGNSSDSAADAPF